MDKKTKLKNLLSKLTKFDDQIKGTFDDLDKEMANVTSKLKETITAKTLDQVNSEFKNLQGTFKPLAGAFEELKKNITQRDQDLRTTLEERLKILNEILTQSQGVNKGQFLKITEDISGIQSQINDLESRKVVIPDFGQQIKDTESTLLKLIEKNKTEPFDSSELDKEILNLQEALKKLRIEFNNRGGGSMNRQIFIGGADPLKKYTDINLKAGSNVTITYANNETTKKVDITIAATGGGGGIARSINSVSSNTNAGSTAGTDYVYLVSGTTTITLPDAAANTNLYTIKNVGSGTVTINTTSSQTIDGSLTITLPVQYTSVDIESDSANWNVT